MSEKLIAVIGAGAAGLTAVKCCLEENLRVVCFEKSDHIGGLWKYSPGVVDGQSSVMRSTIINTSKEMSAFSDFPPPADFPNFMHHTKMHDYLRLYAEKFDLLQHVRFGREVVGLTKCDDFEDTGRWTVRVADGDGAEEEEIVDGVMICTGHHWRPVRPSFPGLDSFEGRMIHSHEYRTPDGFEGSSVLVIGVGNSGVDVAVELSSVAKQVIVSARRGIWILPRVGTYGLPLDIMMNRRLSALFQKILPFSVNCFFFEAMINLKLDHTTYALKPKHRILSEHATTSDGLGSRLVSGTAIIKGDILRFTKRSVIFQDDDLTEYPVDTVVLATGYDVRYPFLEEKMLAGGLYKFVFPPCLQHSTLTFIGRIQPIGALFPVAEMQSRWVAKVMAGKVNLPPKSLMEKDIEKWNRMNSESYTGNRRVPEVSWIGYMDEIAELISVRPDLIRLLFTDAPLAVKCFMGPCLPYQFRLEGPQSWSGARDAIINAKKRVLHPLSTRKCPSKKVQSVKDTIHSTTDFVWYFAVIVVLFLLGAMTLDRCIDNKTLFSRLFQDVINYLPHGR